VYQNAVTRFFLKQVCKCKISEVEFNTQAINSTRH